MSRTVIIDGDIVVYKAAEALTQSFEVELEEDAEFLYRKIEYVRKEDGAKFIDDFIAKIKNKTKADKVCVCLSDVENFRKEINPEYKTNRPKLKPILYKWAREYIQSLQGCKIYTRPKLEADDVIGILVTSDVIIKGDKVIWSMDKDFKTIPCKFYKELPNGKAEKLTITEKEADWWFMYQTLKGDVIDGYKGCYKVGDALARKILGNVGDYNLAEMWEKVVIAYCKHGMSEEDALLNARMARILRNTDYDFKNKEVKLWRIK